jgi:hypothetical protein
MASIINAGTTSNTALNMTADTSGTLALQSNGTTMASATPTGFNIGGVVASGYTMKNRIINGAMVIDQRNAGASVTIPATASQYTVDRWTAASVSASKYSIQQNAASVTPPAGFSNYLGVTSLATTTLAATDYYFLVQPIEGYNVADLGFGTANAKTVTLSFWVRSSLTGTFGGAIQNSNSTRTYPFSYTISSANNWTQISITIAGDTTGTWLITNGAGLNVFFSLGMGSTYSGTANTWASTNYISTTGATSVVGTNGATFYITGVQLEVGSQATSFEYRHYGIESSLCQRYYIGDGTSYYSQGAYDSAYSTEGMFINLPTQMRTSPTVIGYGYTKSGHIGGDQNTYPANNIVAPTSTSLLLRWASGSTAYRSYGYAGFITPYLSAEL